MSQPPNRRVHWLAPGDRLGNAERATEGSARSGALGSGVIVIEDGIDDGTCAALLLAATSRGFAPARLASEGRFNEETFVIQSQLAGSLLAALARHVAVLHGDDLIELYRYDVGQRVGLHVDAARSLSSGASSNATFLCYLSAVAAGGRTLFPDYDLAVVPVRGRAVLFAHGVRHEAEAVLAGEKHVARMSVAVQW